MNQSKMGAVNQLTPCHRHWRQTAGTVMLESNTWGGNPSEKCPRAGASRDTGDKCPHSEATSDTRDRYPHSKAPRDTGGNPWGRDMLGHCR